LESEYWKRLRIPFGAPVDTKADPRVPRSPWARAQNVSLSHAGGFRKRGAWVATDTEIYDTDGGSTSRLGDVSLATQLRGLAGRGTETVLLDSGRVYARATSLNKWMLRGLYDASALRSSPITTVQTQGVGGGASLSPSVGEAAGVRVVAYFRGASANYFIEDSTGAIIKPETQLSAAVSPGAMLTMPFGQTHIGIFYAEAPGANLKVLLVPVANPLFPTTVTIVAADLANGFFGYTFDVAADPDANRLLVAWKSATANTVKAAWCSTAGALTSTTSYATPATALIVAAGWSPTFSRACIAYSYDSGGSHNVDSRITNATLVDQALTVTVAAGAAGPSINNLVVGNAASVPGASAGSFYVMWTNIGASLNNDSVTSNRRGTHSTSSAVSTLRHAYLLTKPFLANQRARVFIGYFPAGALDRGLEATAFLYAEGSDSDFHFMMVGSTLNGLASASLFTTTLPAVIQRQVGGTEWLTAALYHTGVNPASFTIQTDYSQGIRSVTLLTVDVNHHPLTREWADDLLISGGLLWSYDGQYVTEQAFQLNPPEPAVADSGGAGLIGAGSRSYRVYYEYTDGNGRRHKSLAYTATHSNAALKKVVFTIQTLSHTRRLAGLSGEVAIVVYGTEVNPTEESQFYRISSTDPSTAGTDNGYLANDRSVDTVTFTHNMVDALLLDNEIDYQSAGEIEHGIALNPEVLGYGLGRMWVGQGSTIQGSLRLGLNEPAAWNEGQTVSLPQSGGNVTGIFDLAGTLAIFTENAVYMMGGDGPDNLGLSGAWSPVFELSTDVGSTSSHTVARTPEGLLFYRAGRGIYLLTEGRQIQYVGEAVEGYLRSGHSNPFGQTLSVAAQVPGEDAIIFFGQQSAHLVYYHQAKQWVEWGYAASGNAVQGAAVIGGTLTVADQQPGVRQYDPMNFLDDGVDEYFMGAIGAWIPLSPDGSVAWGRCRSFTVTGRLKAPHRLRVGVAYDYREGGYSASELSTDWPDPATEAEAEPDVPSFVALPGQALPPATTDYLYEFGLPHQKARAVRVYVHEESPTVGKTAESAEWSELIVKVAAIGSIATTTGHRAGME
jgi:hypothetical protein